MLGVAVDGRGRVYACDAGNGEIARWDPGPARSETYTHGVGGDDLDTRTSLRSVPTGCCTSPARRGGAARDRADRARRLLRKRLDRRRARVSERRPRHTDGSALIVVESHEQQLVRVAIQADGSAGDVSVVASFPIRTPTASRSPPTATLWVTLYRPDGLVRVAPDGRRGGVRRPSRADLRRADEHRVGSASIGVRRRQRRRTVPVRVDVQGVAGPRSSGGAVMAWRAGSTEQRDRHRRRPGDRSRHRRGVPRGRSARVRRRHPRRRARRHEGPAPDRVSTHVVDLSDFDATRRMVRRLSTH